MLWRFCLYGFLKNQRYFEPFIVLAFLERGYDFFLIGLILGFRELCCNLMEIPSGAVADVLGRRRSMIVSHVMYLTAYIMLGCIDSVPWVFAAMFLFSIGEAFRTGTHKALIFRWLKLNGRQDEKTRIYGLTRSYSKLGSALSSIIAAIMLCVVGDYDLVFWLSAIPTGLNIINFLGYDHNLDLERKAGNSESLVQIFKTLKISLLQCLRKNELRAMLAESMCFEGLFRSSSSFLQPVIKAAALSLPVLYAFGSEKRSFIMIGIIYAVSSLLSSFASRFADKWRTMAPSDDAAAGRMWGIYLTVFASLGVYSFYPHAALAIAAFVVLNTVQNFWRPILISRVAHESGDRTMATVLSVESQSKTLFASVMLPVIGFAMDKVDSRWEFLPLAIMGLVVVLTVITFRRLRQNK